MTRFAPLFLSVLLLSGCQTLDGLGNDLTTAWNASADALTSLTATTPANGARAAADTGPGQETACPSVKVMEELRQMVEFQDISKPTAKSEMARARMTDVTARCSVGGDLSVELDITVETKLGPKARWKKTDKPHFAFPYFVAVITPEGSVMAKEIFAASFSYENGENDMTRTETITQHIPLADDGSIPPYSILVGFQLTEEQLAFNRAQPAATPASAP